MSVDEEQTPAIKSPKQLIVVVLLAFIVPVIVIVLITQLVTGMHTMPMDNPAMSAEEVANRIKPVGKVVVEDGASGGAKAARSGEEIVNTVCAACHASGALNAPKVGDNAAWKPRLAQGLDKLTANAIKGIKQMPPRGGGADLSDSEVMAAVAYMANKSGANFKVPEAKPAETAKPAEAPAPAAAAAKTETAQPAASPAPAAKTAASGKSVYDTSCSACHAVGAAGAPKAGDKNSWAPRLKAGKDTLYQHAINGKGVMPPKGGNPSLSDADVKAAVDYMVSQVK